MSMDMDMQKIDQMLRDGRTMVKFTKNPHGLGTKAYDNYERVKGCGTVGDARKQGASLWDLKKWFEKDSIIILSGMSVASHFDISRARASGEINGGREGAEE
eukprot:10465724-Karenia_brevis.AAC.1